jgi:hypothetical protein
MMDQKGTKHAAVTASYNIIVIPIQLFAFVGLSYSNPDRILADFRATLTEDSLFVTHSLHSSRMA